MRKILRNKMPYFCRLAITSIYKISKFPLRMLIFIQKCHYFGGLILKSWQWTCINEHMKERAKKCRHKHRIEEYISKYMLKLQVWFFFSFFEHAWIIMLRDLHSFIIYFMVQWKKIMNDKCFHLFDSFLLLGKGFLGKVLR